MKGAFGRSDLRAGGLTGRENPRSITSGHAGAGGPGTEPTSPTVSSVTPSEHSASLSLSFPSNRKLPEVTRSVQGELGLAPTSG